ncbi:MAG: alpha/beta hydrolase [Longimicrobiales bacterium]|nr:alpha/beta hydrolase [Longimicrobiales bacterium]
MPLLRVAPFVALLVLSAHAPAQELLTAADLQALPDAPPDHTISYGPADQNFGHLYLPDGPGPHPVVAFIHGGCFLSAFDITHTASLSRAVADAGYAVWSVEYRRVGDEGGGWPNTFDDVGRAVDHLRHLALVHDLDLDRLVVAGHSAGGTLALWAAARSRIPESSPLYVADPLRPSAVFGLAAVGDLEAVHMQGSCGNVVDRLMGGGPVEVPERYAAASPMQLVPLDVPVVSLVGSRDPWTPPSVSWVHRARAVGMDEIRLVELPRSGHFEMIAPATPTWSSVMRALHETFGGLGR